MCVLAFLRDEGPITPQNIQAPGDETLAIEKLPEAERLANLNILMRQEEAAPPEMLDDEDEHEAA